jgi:hypothetical protein
MDMQSGQGFPIPSAVAEAPCVQYALVIGFEPKTHIEKILPFSAILHSTLALNRACMVVTDAEPDRLAPLPRQRR